MKLQRIIGIFLAAVMLITPLTACSKKEGASGYAKEKYGFQLDKPGKGEKIAVMSTTMGDIKIRFFPKAAPKAVENFITHSEKGYYNGLLFHRVINDFMVQGGDPQGTGQGGESIWGTPFEDEFDSKLMNLRGSLAMANSGKNTNGSQFFINQATAASFRGKEAYESAAEQYHNGYNQSRMQAQSYYNSNKEQVDSRYGSFEAFFEAQYYLAPDPKLVPEEVWELYKKTGGNISLDGPWRSSGGHTVFAQVFEGMDVVDKISAVETDENDKPKTDVKINTIKIVTYNG